MDPLSDYDRVHRWANEQAEGDAPQASGFPDSACQARRKVAFRLMRWIIDPYMGGKVKDPLVFDTFPAWLYGRLQDYRGPVGMTEGRLEALAQEVKKGARDDREDAQLLASMLIVILRAHFAKMARRNGENAPRLGTEAALRWVARMAFPEAKLEDLSFDHQVNFRYMSDRKRIEEDGLNIAVQVFEKVDPRAARVESFAALLPIETERSGVHDENTIAIESLAPGSVS